MSAKQGNKYAVKDDSIKSTSHLHIRVTPAEKAAWVKAANGQKLSAWVVDTLNKAT